MLKTYINLSYSSDETTELFFELLHSNQLRIDDYDLEENGHDLYVNSNEILYFLTDLAYYFNVSLNREDNEYYGHVDWELMDEALDVKLYKK